VTRNNTGKSTLLRVIFCSVFLFSPCLASAQNERYVGANLNTAETQQLRLQNQELLVNNERLRTELAAQVNLIKVERDRDNQLMMLMGAGIFLVGLAAGLWLGVKLKNRV